MLKVSLIDQTACFTRLVSTVFKLRTFESISTEHEIWANKFVLASNFFIHWQLFVTF